MDKEQYRKMGYRLGEWLLAAAFLSCTLFLYLLEYPVIVIRHQLFLVIGLITAFSMFCFYGGKKRKWLIFLYEALFLSYGLFEMKRLALGFCLFINPWLPEFTAYYEIAPLQFAVEELTKAEAESLTLGFISFLLFFMAPAVTGLVCRGRGAVWFILAGSFTLVLNLTTGNVPEAGALLLWLSLFITLLGTSRREKSEREHRERIKAALFMAGVFCLLTAFAGKVFTPELYAEKIDLKEPKQKLQTAGNDFWEKVSSFGLGTGKTYLGLSKGELKNAGNLNYTGETRLTLTYQKQNTLLQPMLLRSYVGEVYTGDSFKPSKTLRKSEEYKKLKKDLMEYGIYIDSPEISHLSSFVIRRRNVTVTNVSAEERVYVPYWAENPIEIKDGWIGLANRKKEKEYELSVVADNREAEMALMFFGYNDERQTIAYQRAMEKYAKLTEDVYLQLPENSELAKKVRKERNTIGYDSSREVYPVYAFEMAMDYVRKTLDEQADYSMTAEKVPEGEDFVDYFFFESKKGYCMHFAAAGTTMFRALGIPARYVEGYVVNNKLIRKTEKNYQMAETVELNIPDRNAHAWVEIYNGTGWMPVEVTPGYNTSTSMAEIEQVPLVLFEKPEETKEPETTTPPEESEKPEETKKPEESEKPEETKEPEESLTPGDGEPGSVEPQSDWELFLAWSVKVGKRLLAGAAFIAAAAALLWSLRALVIYRKRRIFIKADAAQRIKLYYKEILNCPEAEHFEDFDRLTVLAYKAAFARKVSKEEEKIAGEYYHRLWKEICQLSPKRRIILYKYFKIFGEL